MSGPKGIDYFIGDGSPSLAGDAFVVIKASEGAGYPPDGAPEIDWYSQQQARVRAAGDLFGAFLFWHPSVDNAAQVANFKKRANLQPGDIGQLDCEVTDGLDWATVNARKNDMLARLKAEFPHNRWLLYTYLDFWNHLDANAGDGLWIADPSAPAGQPRVQHWVIHQYASSDVDYDIANFPDAAALRAWAFSLIPRPQPPHEKDDLMLLHAIQPNPNDQNDKPGIWLLSGPLYFHVLDEADCLAYRNAGVPQIGISYAQHKEILARIALLQDVQPTGVSAIGPAGSTVPPQPAG
jgi:hypothetical protein